MSQLCDIDDRFAGEHKEAPAGARIVRIKTQSPFTSAARSVEP